MLKRHTLHYDMTIHVICPYNVPAHPRPVQNFGHFFCVRIWYSQFQYIDTQFDDSPLPWLVTPLRYILGCRLWLPQCGSLAYHRLHAERGTACSAAVSLSLLQKFRRHKPTDGLFTRPGSLTLIPDSPSANDIVHVCNIVLMVKFVFSGHWWDHQLVCVCSFLVSAFGSWSQQMQWFCTYITVSS